MKKFFRDNGLSIVLFVLFLFSMTGQYLTGYEEYKDGQKQHGQAAVGYLDYLGEGHFIEATFENWESEFLQMGMYIVLTIFLFQKGSSESKDPDKSERVDRIPPEARHNPEAPSPVRRSGWQLKIYENSLSLAFLLLFILSFALHAYGGAEEFSQEQLQHGGFPVSTLEFIRTSRFWFESFQNWQSEFLSVGLMIFMSIYLRQKGSPESKAVDAPHDETGTA